ncbi:hypothetical protein F444_13046 [Phytophthora nicotianae P1976]|uniref:Uncharacterized protein n=1 Tax=Phytophthora nicotianae P1976 TaxID=1317066 RepID=A0A080ZV11_PHYNI|nr:hypothetical protein F444_13046 [Phytophthora nicotianae P1976]
MNTDELNALEATLAFFDTCDGVVTEFSSGHSSDESSHSVHNMSAETITDVAVGLLTNSSNPRGHVSAEAEEIVRVKAKLEVPGRNRSRDLQKLELLQLRVEAEALQQRVEELQFLNGDIENPLTALITGTSSWSQRSDEIRRGAWQGMAKRQKKLRKEAESENEQLRGLVESQLKTVKTLKRLFYKQGMAKINPGLSRGLNASIISDGPSQEYKVLEKLSRNLSDLFSDTDSVFESNGLRAISSPFLQVNKQPLSAANTRIDLLKCDVLPFEYRTVAKIFADKMASNFESEEDKHIPSNLKENVVARATTLELEQLKIQFRFTGYKYAEVKREVIVLSGQNKLLEAFGVAVDGIRYQEKSWCILSEMSPGVCLIQLCISVTLEAKPLVDGRRGFVNKLCELLAGFKQDMFDSVQQEVERDLLRAS